MRKTVRRKKKTVSRKTKKSSGRNAVRKSKTRRVFQRIQKRARKKTQKIPSKILRPFKPNASRYVKTEELVRKLEGEGLERSIQIRFSTSNSSNEYEDYDQAVETIKRLFVATETKIRARSPKPPFYRLLLGIEGEGFRSDSSGTVSEPFFIWREAIVAVVNNDLWAAISDAAPLIMKDFAGDPSPERKRKSDDADFYLIRRCRIYVEKRLPLSTKKAKLKKSKSRRH